MHSVMQACIISFESSSDLIMLCCRKGPLGGKASSKWFHTSDTTVKQVSYSEVSRAAAYMLFYEKQSDSLDVQ